MIGLLGVAWETATKTNVWRARQADDPWGTHTSCDRRTVGLQPTAPELPLTVRGAAPQLAVPGAVATAPELRPANPSAATASCKCDDYQSRMLHPPTTNIGTVSTHVATRLRLVLGMASAYAGTGYDLCWDGEHPVMAHAARRARTRGAASACYVADIRLLRVMLCMACSNRRPHVLGPARQLAGTSDHGCSNRWPQYVTSSDGTGVQAMPGAGTGGHRCCHQPRRVLELARSAGTAVPGVKTASSWCVSY